jgi:phosphomannomutase
MEDISHIFKAIDIRGIYGKDINEEIMEKIGYVIANYVDSEDIVVSSDVRNSSPALRKALINGIILTGKNVIDIEEMPVGVAAFYGWKNNKVMGYVTASHLSKEWNGLKFFHKGGQIFEESENATIRDKFFLTTVEKSGKRGRIKKENREKILEDYANFLKQKIKIKNIKIAVDCGNGATSFLNKVFEKIGFEPVFINDTPDGNFPNRPSNPELSELMELKKLATQSDISVAFDGDGDRICLIDDKGRNISVEQYTVIILNKLFKENKGGVVANVECSNLIDLCAKKFGRKIYRVKVGHTFMINGVEKYKACFGIEKSGHCLMPSIAVFHDVVPILIYISSIILSSNKKLSEMVDELPKPFFYRENLHADYKIKDKTMETLKNKILKDHKNVDTMDGVRINFEDAWVLIRGSNTEPTIRVSVEAQSQKRLDSLKKLFIEKVGKEIKRHASS